MYFVRDPGTTKSRNHLDGAKGDIEEDRGERVKAERLDDERTKSRDATARDTVVNVVISDVLCSRVEVLCNLRDREHEAEPEPRLWVEHGFADMVPFPDTRANAHLIHAETLNGNDFFVVFEELGLHG